MEPREADSEGEAKDHKRQAQYGVEGCAPHSRSLCCHTVGRRRGKKANLHLQTSQQQTRGHADRPDAQTVAKATRYPNGDNRGEAVRTTDQHHQTLRGRGARGGQPQRTPNKPGQPTGPDTEANLPTKGGKGKPARPRGDQTHERRNNDKTKNHRDQLQKQQGKENATGSDQGRATKGNRTKVQ